MKKILLFIALCVTTLTASAQTTRTLTFDEPSSYWNSLIDSPQYGGSLLYGSTIYSWSDANNTMLCSSIPLNYGEHKYWGGGEAISDYWSGILSQGDYMHQLAVYVPNNQSSGNGGHGYGGSKNFAVHFGYADTASVNKTTNLSYIEFMDGRARYIDSMFVNNTTYFVNVARNGNGFSTAMADTNYVDVVAIGTDANGNKTYSSFQLAEGTQDLVTEWSKWNMTSLGKVKKVEFNFDSNLVDQWGMTIPAYFCYDNITVRDSLWNTSNKVKAAIETRSEDNVSDSKSLILDISSGSVVLKGDVPEGCSTSLSTTGNPEWPVQLSAGTHYQINVSGLPSNAKINKLVINGSTQPRKGKATNTGTIGETEIFHFDWGGKNANHGFVNSSYDDIDMEVTLVDNLPLIGDNDLILTFECLAEYANVKSYTISYVLEDADDEPAVATFEDFALAPESYWAGDEEGEDWYYGLGYQQRFKSGKYSFVNYCIPDYDTWIGYAVSNQTSTDFASTADQFKSCVGTGVNGSANYCVAYPDGTMWGETLSIEVEGGAKVVPGFYITNSAYVVNSITKGDSFAGDPFTVGDYFKLTIHALDADGNETATRDFCLADYRFENEADRYCINDWQYVDLSQLGEAAAFTFTFEASRKNNYGPLTPTYFCIDDFGAEGEETVREEGTYNGDVDGIQTVTYETRPVGIFTIDGRRVNSTTKPGLYIINGRKVMVK